ncbi:MULTISPECIES: hypothetical protein [Streptomyces]|uniref:hypothetical protein n=1 Tax=Streptomyces TaxID=1883 RepID=UPI0025B46A88|nr:MULTISPECIES: hypothetical protein [unclassified Streptomyces]MDN3250591.1 hypothetical protein [Streptomyces sp. ZSW22]MDN3257889.1 hypothetical protein [Streptomyces sp. MA25(2023)]
MTPTPGHLDDTVIRAGTRALSRPPVDARLRRILALDATGMILFGLAYLVARVPLARLLGVGDTLVITVGGLMLTIGTGVALLALRTRPPSACVLSVIVIGAAWVAASIASLALDWWDTTTVGTVWITLQAVPVSLLSIVQFAALRARTRRPARPWGSL